MQNTVHPRLALKPNRQSPQSRPMRSGFLLIALTVIALMTGCKMAPKYQAPATREHALERMEIREDSVDRIRWRYHKSLLGYGVTAAPMELYIGQQLDPPYAVWLRLRAKWTGERWAFLNGITVNVDGVRYDWNELAFKRDVGSSSTYTWVQESIDFPLDEGKRSVIDAIIESDHAVMRFRGERGVRDIELTANDRLIYRDVLTAFDLLQDNPQQQVD